MHVPGDEGMKEIPHELVYFGQNIVQQQGLCRVTCHLMQMKPSYYENLHLQLRLGQKYNDLHIIY